MRIRFAVCLGILAVLLSSCGGSSDNADELAKRLDHAKTQLDDATTVSIKLKADDLPGDATGLLTAEGKGNHDPAFTGDVTVQTGGASLSAEVIAVAGKLWAKTSFAPSFISVDPESLKAPNPATLLSGDDGISSLLTNTDKLADEGEKRSGSDVVTSVSGVLDGEIVKRLIPSADVSKKFDVVYALSDDDELVNARLTGPFYPDVSSMTYTVRVSTSSKPTKISAP